MQQKKISSVLTRILSMTLLTLALSFGGMTSGSAQELTKELEAKLIFESNSDAKISYNNYGESADDTTTNKLQSTMIFYAYAMNAIDSTARTSLLNQTQKMILQVASEQGLARPNILKGNDLAKVDGAQVKDRGFQITFGALANRGNTLQVEAIGEKDPKLFIPATFQLFQDQIKNLPDNGLRIMVLGLGAMNEWYQKNTDKISEPSSIATASTHGLKTAVEIMEAVGKIKP